MPQVNEPSPDPSGSLPLFGLTPFRVGLRYLLKKRLSYMAMLGVALSVGVLIVVMSVMMGFDQQLRSVIRGYQSDIKVTPLTSRLYGFKEEKWKEVREMALNIAHVKAAAPFIDGPGLLVFSEGKKAGEHMQHVFFRGIDPELEPGVSGFDSDFMSEGSLADLARTYVPDKGKDLSHCLIGSAQADGSPFEQVMRTFYVHAAATRAGELALGLRSPGASRSITAELDEAVSGIEGWVRAVGQEEPKARRAAIKALRGVSKDGLSPEARAKLQEAVSLVESGLPEEERERIARQFRSVREAPDYEAAGRRLDEIIAGERARYPLAVDIFKLYRERILRYEVVLFTVSPGADSSSRLPERRLKAFRVADTFQTGRFDYDSKVVLVPLKDAMAFVNSNGGVTGLNIRLDDYAHAPEVVAQLRAELGDFYIIQTWEDQERPFLEAVAMEQFLMAVIQSFVGILAGFCIFAILTMTVYEKRHDIGVLKAIGFTPAAIARVFLFDGAAIGIIGAAVGVAGGRLFAVYINEIADLLERLTGWAPFPETVYYFKEIPVDMAWRSPIIIGASALLCSLVFSLFPAIKAARLDPVESLRYE